jgi:hypothetical protein
LRMPFINLQSTNAVASSIAVYWKYRILWPS